MSESHWSTADDGPSREVMLNAVLESIGDAIFVKDLAGRYIIMNSAHSEAIGRSVNDVLGRTDQEIWPDVAEALRENDQWVVETGQRLSVEELTIVNGQPRTFLSTKTALRDAQGTVIGLVGVARDIEDRKQADLELRRKTELLQAVNSAMAVYLERADWRESMTILLRAALKLTGSQCGLIGIMDRAEGLRVLQVHDESSPHADNSPRTLSKERLTFEELQAWCPRLRKAFADILQSGATVFLNELPPATEPTFDAHLQRFLGVPLLCDAQVIGILAVGNSPEEYAAESSGILESLLNHASVLSDVSLRQERQRSLENERSLAEQRRRETEEEFRLLVTGVSDYALYTTTPDGHIRSWNPGASRLFGYSADEILDREIRQLYPAQNDRQLQSDEELQFAALTGRHESEGWLLRKNGTPFWAHGVTTALRDSSGKLRGFARITRDETHRMLSEEQLREALTFNRQIIASAQEGIVVFDHDLQYLVWNPYLQRLSGVSERDLIGRHPYDVFPFQRDQGIEPLLTRTLAGETIEGDELQFHFEDGRAGWVSAVWSPLRDSTGRINGVIAFIRDITERVRTQRKMRVYYDRLQALSRRLLSVQEQERRHLARELHDEIGQVLTAVNLNLHALRKEFDDPGRGRFFDCEQTVQRAIQMVRDLSINLRPSMLDDLGLEPALRWFLDKQSKRSGFQFSLHSDIPLGAISSDVETACFRIVQESVTNISRHAKAQRVRVRVTCMNSHLQLTVSDDGIGFDAVAVMNRAVQGNSFGVLGMQERAELLGGDFVLHSAPGEGTHLTATFPLQEIVVAGGVTLLDVHGH